MVTRQKTANLTIKPTLTVTADSKSITYGDCRYLRLPDDQARCRRPASCGS